MLFRIPVEIKFSLIFAVPLFVKSTVVKVPVTSRAALFEINTSAAAFPVISISPLLVIF